MLIIDLSGVYREEAFASALDAASKDYVMLDLRKLEGTSCYLGEDSGRILRRELAPYSEEKLRFIDSGDYHYLSALLAEMLYEGPFTMVLLDNHPDNQEPEFPGMLSCGSWAGAIGNPLLEKVVIFGPEGCLRDIPSLRKEVRGSGRVYISLDKDIMSRDYARTDWSQGEFTLNDVKDALLAVSEEAGEIVAVDVCGEISRAKGGREEDFGLNLRTNMELMRFISEELLGC